MSEETLKMVVINDILSLLIRHKNLNTPIFRKARYMNLIDLVTSDIKLLEKLFARMERDADKYLKLKTLEE